MKLRCYRIFEDSKSFSKGRLCEIDSNELTSGEVQVEVCYSSVNYKDALAGLGKGKI